MYAGKTTCATSAYEACNDTCAVFVCVISVHEVGKDTCVGLSMYAFKDTCEVIVYVRIQSVLYNFYSCTPTSYTVTACLFGKYIINMCKEIFFQEACNDTCACPCMQIRPYKDMSLKLFITYAKTLVK